MSDIERLREILKDIPDEYIVLLETTPEKAFEMGLASVKFFSERNDSGIIVSSNRPYVNLINNYKNNNIDVSRMFILDLISKSQDADIKANNVQFIDNVSSLTDISLSINEQIRNNNGRKFVFFDSIPTMLIHNKPYIFARFVHSILTKMRINGVGGVLVFIKGTNNDTIRAEIAQLCDKVIKI